MEDTTKPAYRTVYAIFDAAGKWHETNQGALLAYTTEADARQGFKIHGGAKITRFRLMFDGDVEVTDVHTKE